MKTVIDRKVIILKGYLKGFEGYIVDEDNNFYEVEVHYPEENIHQTRVYLKENVVFSEKD